MKLSRPLPHAALVAFALLSYSAHAEEIPAQSSPRNAAAERLTRATNTLQEFRKNATGVTRKLFDSAHCILVAPRRLADETSMGAPGFVTCRSASGGGWTKPAAVEVADGGVVWWVIGAQMDLVILAENPGAAAALQSRNVMFGVDPVVQPGPVTEDQVRSQPASAPLLFSYEQSSDGIKGIQLAGATLSEEPDANAALYGKRLSTSDVFTLKAGNTKPAALSPFLAALPSASREGM
ncbi:MAG TPA: lipid-binding SYLF domain-containing protein [Bryobacteraceae bacterium]|nr:lipid-binding SYLF domain-containing protein [Bryobacteraceae bacterium]